jgi:methyltransferase (TIGR00027 family)
MNPVEQAVAGTGLLVAAIRARESGRADALFRDPYAERLAGPAGRQMLEAALAQSGEQSTLQIVVRTRFWDEALLCAAVTAPQVVLCAAGMDARAYRLEWPDGTCVYELDQPAVIAAKSEALAEATPRTRRVTLDADLTDDAWTTALPDLGFDPRIPSMWLIEGLLQYLDEAAVQTLFDRIDALTAPGSTLLYDVVGRSLLEAPFMAPLLNSMAAQGSPWLFGTDTPGTLAERRGWRAQVFDIAEVGNRWNRWFAPAVPMGVPGVPRGYFVEAHK